MNNRFRAVQPLAGPALLFLLALSGLGLRLYQLGAQSLWLDEGGTWAEVTRQSWGWLLGDLARPTAAYPLYHLLLKAWVAVAGDSEWALRFPSALAGGAMVGVLLLAEREIALARGERGPVWAAGLLAAVAPYALWHAQDAKAYSLLMLVVALLLWAALCVLRRGTRSTWLLLGAVAVASVFVHRLALMPVAAIALGLAAQPRRAQMPGLLRWWRAALGAVGLASAGLGVLGLARSVASNGWQESGHSAAGPLESIGLNLSHFALDRGNIAGFLGIPGWLWALPTIALAVWGVVLLLRDALRGSAAARLVLVALAVPLLLFALALAFTPVYEPRYASVAFPAWVLALAWPFQRVRVPRPLAWRASAALAATLVLATNAAVLLQPEHGQFSGAPVKEAWRQAITTLAGELHPDDLFVLHPYYTLPMWQYYAPRVTPDPLPQPQVFAIFGQGNCVEVYRGSPADIRDCFRWTYDDPFNQAAYGKKRAILLIAPDHAATIDPPKTLADLQQDYAAGIWNKDDPAPTTGDTYGWVGLGFAYPQSSWPCGGLRFVGLETMCQSFPATYNAGGPGQIPAPETPLQADFGSEIRLLGYSIDPLGGQARPGGALPITLYWQSLVDPSKNYSMFIHLCRDCEQPPLAHVDERPLHGYAPAGLTTTWRGYPVHDERSLPLPADLPPGRYTLILGVRPADEDWQDLSLRLPVTTSAETLGTARLVLGTVEISAP